MTTRLSVPIKRKSELPVTFTRWTDEINGKEYESILSQLESRPVIAWFDIRRKRGVRLLVRLTNIFYNLDNSRNEWSIVSNDGISCSGRKILTLKEALSLLPPSPEWLLCEFETNIEYHRAVLSYFQ